MFQSFFRDFFPVGGATQRTPQPAQYNKPPPASAAAMAQLPNVQVTADDLLEETNKECAICLDDQRIGQTACKLPCGHLFHRPCVVSWLEKQCTCPSCRFELETADAVYESQRKARMQSRKLRIRVDELHAKKVSELRQLCRSLEVDISNCVDKRDIVERLQASGRITITQGLPPVEVLQDDFHQKSVSELKHLLLSFGLSTEGALEKSELRNRLLNSGRIVLVSSTAYAATTTMDDTTAEVETRVEEMQVDEEVVVDAQRVDVDVNLGAMAAVEDVTVADESDNDVTTPCTEEPFAPVSSPPSTINSYSSQSNSHPSAASQAPPVPPPTATSSPRTTMSREVLSTLRIRELRAILEAYEIDISSCLYREDLMDLLMRSPEIQLID